jgi:hypothetical protein
MVSKLVALRLGPFWAAREAVSGRESTSGQQVWSGEALPRHR